jgi:soluble epoxide hydrolase / lipid-phosphate phosphatase
VVLSRLSMLYSDRLTGFVWLGLSFMEPVTFNFDLDAVMAAMKQLLGYEGYSYWQFFLREDASRVIEQNVSTPHISGEQQLVS